MHSKTIFAVALLAASLFALACLDFGNTGPSTTQQQQVTINPAPPSPSPAATATPPAAGFCTPPSSPVDYVRFGIRSGATCRVEADRGCAIMRLSLGTVATLDISPLSGNALTACHGPLDLTLAGAGCELRSGGGTDFLPNIAGTSTGDCRLTATVNGTSNVLAIEVR